MRRKFVGNASDPDPHSSHLQLTPEGLAFAGLVQIRQRRFVRLLFLLVGAQHRQFETAEIDLLHHHTRNVLLSLDSINSASCPRVMLM